MRDWTGEGRASGTERGRGGVEILPRRSRALHKLRNKSTGNEGLDGGGEGEWDGEGMLGRDVTIEYSCTLLEMNRPLPGPRWLSGAEQNAAFS